MWVVNFSLKLVHLYRPPLQKITTPETLYEAVVEVDERVVLERGSCQLQLNTPTVTGNTGEKVGREGREKRRKNWLTSFTPKCMYRNLAKKGPLTIKAPPTFGPISCRVKFYSNERPPMHISGKKRCVKYFTEINTRHLCV